MISTNWDAICAGISKSLFSKPFSLPANINWEGVYEEAKGQSIAALVYDGLHSVLPPEVKGKWKVHNLQQVAHCVQIMHETQALDQLLNDNKIRYCILKGTAASIYYPQPMFRVMGDIDFYIAPEAVTLAKEILTSNEFVVSKKDEENPRHLILFRNGIRFEMHHLFGSTQFDNSILIKGMNRIHTSEIEGTKFSMLSDLENGMILLDHFRQELLEAVGIRHLLDWMMYVYKVLDDRFWREHFQRAAQEFGLEILAITLTRMCQMFFGLPVEFSWCTEAEEVLCVRLMESLIQAGGFGVNLGEGKHVEKTIINFRREGVFRFLQKAGEYNWKAYHTHPYLKPFAWIYQIGRYARQGIQVGNRRSRREIQHDLERSSTHYDLLKDLNVL